MFNWTWCATRCKNAAIDDCGNPMNQVAEEGGRMSKPIRCIECYKNRPGGRCDFCPLHLKNKSHYTAIGNGYYVRKENGQEKDRKDRSKSTKR